MTDKFKLDRIRGSDIESEDGVSVKILCREDDQYASLRREIYEREFAHHAVPETPESIAEVDMFLHGKRRGFVQITGAPRNVNISEHMLRQAQMAIDYQKQAIEELMETPGATFDTSARTERVVGKSGYTYPRAKQGRGR